MCEALLASILRVSAGTCSGCIAGTKQLSLWCLLPAAGHM